MSDPVLIERAGGIATLTLDDPDRRNVLSPELIDALVAALGTVGAEADTRCVILTGAGTAFSAGGNPKRMLQPGLYPDMSPVELREHYRHGIQRIPLAIAALEVPIIAAINGPAIGAGLDTACFCDLRIAADTASFASSFVKLGLVAGDGGAWVLPRVIGMANAMELMLTGEAIDPARAQAIGLVSRVVPADMLMDEARALAARILRNPPVTVRLVKKLARDCVDLTLPAALDLSAATQALAQRTDDHREAVEAFLEKRAPRFTGR